MADLHLLFLHRGVRYALDAALVQEVVWLPELSPVAEALPCVIGAFNLRGHVISVIDLAPCFGRERSDLGVGDAVIVLTVDGERFGILAGEVLDAATIASGDIEDVRDHHRLLGNAASLVSGVAMSGVDLAMVLDARALLADAAAGAAPPVSPPAGAAAGGTACPDGVAETFRARAGRMARPQEAPVAAGSASFALVGLDGGFFGIPARVVREFVHLSGVRPVPCCPAHILGSMNLRCDILTVVDLRPVLGLPARLPLAEVVVVQAGDLTVGLAVSEVHDVVATGASGSAVPAPGDNDLPFCRGPMRADGRIFSIIDIEAMLASRVLHVAAEPDRDRPEPRNAAPDARGKP
ncbi:CheW protein [Azoarcus sp. CIB]|uniref:chemotaxis protein CheW n=1 Tax=Aromatoleum sp. (strain CIB) TaxID=198107 RepID=UPI00067DD909|nr:chemotaxis protein CheW [Azoarcus sp. CIB]AKU12238.1 CheW protein [Azoarcus sp. CIB]